jgi:hypothetical protein
MYDTTYIDLTTDTNIRLLVSITKDGTMTVTDPTAPTVGVTITFNEPNSTGCIGAALSRSIARAVFVARNLVAVEHPDEYDNDLLIELVRDGISAILKGETGIPPHFMHIGQLLTGCIIAEMTMKDDISDDAHRAFVNANNLTD